MSTLDEAIQQLESTNPTVVEYTRKYDPNIVYTVYVNPANRHITGFVGFSTGVEYLNDGNGFQFYNISDLTEDEYKSLSMSINSTECMAFLGDDNRTIIVRRILIDLLDGTFYDGNSKMLYGVDNIIKLRVRCVDNTETTADDVSEIIIKNVKKNRNPMSINGMDPDVVKTSVANPDEVTLELLGEGVHTIKVKGKLPTVQYLWLTAYPQMFKLSGEQNTELKRWLAAQQSS